MNFSLIFKSLGLLHIMLALAMLVPALYGAINGDGGLDPLILSFLFTILFGAVFYLYNNKADGIIRSRGAIFLVALAWFFVATFGALPFYFSGHFSSYIDCWFESASGFTTTGASVLSDIESVPESILLWRSLIQFLGGMGIIVLSLAIFPLIGVGGMHIYKAEVPGPTSDKLTARVSETARVLWLVYLGFTVVLTLLLYFFGMSMFDAINHALTTMATGGFSTKNSSIASFDNKNIEAIITLFMFFAGINFFLHYRFFVKRDLKALKDSEFKFYSFVVFSTIILITISEWVGGVYQNFLDSFRYAAFQVVSLVSSTGFGTYDFTLWSPFSQILIVMIMLCGGMAGSTAGGIKCMRIMMLLKQSYRELYILVHPKAVRPLKLGEKPIEVNVISAIVGFFFLYLTLLALSTLIVCATGVDIVTSSTAVISSLSNIGPGLGDVSPVLNYGSLPEFSKAVLAACMIIGRLEIFTILVIFTPEFWRA